MILMKETRGGRYGRNLAVLLDYVLDSLPADKKYRRAFLKELQNYCLEPRREGTPRNKRDCSELEGIAEVDVKDPRELARLVKEGIHLMYQKETARRVLCGLLERLEG